MVEIKVSRFSRSKEIVPAAAAAEDEYVQPVSSVSAAVPAAVPASGGDGFLAHLNSDKFAANLESKKAEIEHKELTDKQQKAATLRSQKEAEKSIAAAHKAMEKAEKLAAKPAKKAAATTASNEDEEGTQLLGRERIILLQKIRQYQNLFPDKLKSFKLPKNPSQQTLEDILVEMEVIVDVAAVDLFVSDAIISCVRILEGATCNLQNYNLTGLASMLKENPQFNTLSKQLAIKYGCYSAVPPEIQISMVIITSVYIVTHKNKNQKNIENFLNEPIQMSC